MIEVVYKEEKKKPVGNEGVFRIPRNIRQIGEVNEDFKIYIEDYAYHYLDRMSEDVSGAKIGLLLGSSNWAQGESYVFIRSAFELKGMEIDENHIAFTDEIWAQAQNTAEEYFPDQEVVGWFFAMAECAVEPTETMYRTHMNYFAGSDRVFLLRESLDGEEAFFRYDDGRLCRQSGYYLYYERNEAMQNYMVEENHNMPMESGDAVDDQAVKNFRRIISRKAEEQEERQKKQEKPGFGVMFGTAAAALLLAFVLGTNYLNDFQALKSTRGTVERVISRVQSGTSGTEGTISGTERTASGTDGIQSGVPAASTVMPDGAAEDGTASNRSDEEETTKAPSEKKQDAETTSSGDEDTAKQTSKATSEPTSAETFQTYTTYTIRLGDTLTSISQSYYGNRDMVDAICRMNGISRDTIIYEGEKLLLP